MSKQATIISKGKMTQSSFDKMIRDAKDYHEAHPKDKYWKYHFQLSKGVKTDPPMDYPKKKKWTWTWLKKKPAKKRRKK